MKGEMIVLLASAIAHAMPVETPKQECSPIPHFLMKSAIRAHPNIQKSGSSTGHGENQEDFVPKHRRRCLENKSSELLLGS